MSKPKQQEPAAEQQAAASSSSKSAGAALKGTVRAVHLRSPHTHININLYICSISYSFCSGT